MHNEYNTRQTLIQRIQANHDERSWDEFVRIYRPYIYAIIRNMNVSADDVDDLVQQVCLKVWKNIAGMELTATHRFRSWLSSVTINCTRDYFRKSARDAARVEKAADEESLNYLRSVDEPEIGRIAQREWEIHLTNLALENIEPLFIPQTIEVFMLSLEGMSVKDIAEKTRLSLNAVYYQKNRFKRRLVQEIAHLRDELE
ncbi:ECF RNA polymerase sigma factor SigE [Pontiella desulfatans]|uniref:RNA polymerase sigma factor SigS n=1 Tax=Pontiella desulfatans TaxID=2750659 RepID=A0A6C2U5P3_PONDE|nr:RNA polymerase sigma factor [Pontiella desulfatans]VGO15398.1 ECF RNA polymerase sigma factor SigE [Pontiella desulfatans]